MTKYLFEENYFHKIEDILSKFDEIEFAYVFGSFLEGKSFEDIDVALFVCRDMKPYKRLKFSMNVARKIEREIKPRREIDVKVLNYVPINFQYEVIKTGMLVFSRNEAKRIRYESHTISQYLDYEETSTWFDKKFLEV